MTTRQSFYAVFCQIFTSRAHKLLFPIASYHISDITIRFSDPNFLTEQ